MKASEHENEAMPGSKVNANGDPTTVRTEVEAEESKCGDEDCPESPLPSPNAVSRAANVSHIQFLAPFEELSTSAQNILQMFGMNELPTTKQELGKLLQKINKAEDLKAPPKPQPPSLKKGQSIETKVLKIQKYIESYEYNHTDRFSYYDVKKTQGLYRICRTSKDILSQALPIKCIEAVFLGVYFTNDITGLTRIPIAFRSKVGDHFFEHIVLAIQNNTNRKWGAIGLSRKDTLMYKPLKFDSLGALLTNYKESYEECFHKLYYVYVGLPFGRDMYNQEEILWRALKLNVSSGWEAVVANADKFADDAVGLFDTYCTSGKLPKNFVTKYGSCSKKKTTESSVPKVKGSASGTSKVVSPSKKSKKSVVKKKKKKKRQKGSAVKKNVAKKLAAAVWATNSDVVDSPTPNKIVSKSPSGQNQDAKDMTPDKT